MNRTVSTRQFLSNKTNIKFDEKNNITSHDRQHQRLKPKNIISNIPRPLEKRKSLFKLNGTVSTRQFLSNKTNVKFDEKNNITSHDRQHQRLKPKNIISNIPRPLEKRKSLFKLNGTVSTRQFLSNKTNVKFDERSNITSHHRQHKRLKIRNIASNIPRPLEKRKSLFKLNGTVSTRHFLSNKTNVKSDERSNTTSHHRQQQRLKLKNITSNVTRPLVKRKSLFKLNGTVSTRQFLSNKTNVKFDEKNNITSHDRQHQRLKPKNIISNILRPLEKRNRILELNGTVSTRQFLSNKTNVKFDEKNNITSHDRQHQRLKPKNIISNIPRPLEKRNRLLELNGTVSTRQFLSNKTNVKFDERSNTTSHHRQHKRLKIRNIASNIPRPLEKRKSLFKLNGTVSTRHFLSNKTNVKSDERSNITSHHRQLQRLKLKNITSNVTRPLVKRKSLLELNGNVSIQQFVSNKTDVKFNEKKSITSYHRHQHLKPKNGRSMLHHVKKHDNFVSIQRHIYQSPEDSRRKRKHRQHKGHFKNSHSNVSSHFKRFTKSFILPHEQNISRDELDLHHNIKKIHPKTDYSLNNVSSLRIIDGRHLASFKNTTIPLKEIKTKKTVDSFDSNRSVSNRNQTL